MKPIRLASVFLAASFALSVPAAAQVGGLINKAKQAAEKKATAGEVGTDPKIGEPFTEATLQSAMTGMRTFKARMTEFAKIRDQYGENQSRITDLREKNAKPIETYEENQRKNQQCFDDTFSEINSKSQQAMQQKMMGAMGNQELITKMANLSVAMSQALAKNDTIAFKKARDDQYKLLGVDMKADSAAARAKCGAPPARPAVFAEVQKLELQNDTLSIRMRAVEGSAEGDGAKAAGVPLNRFQQMRERLTLFISYTDKFGGAEGAVLKPKRAEIDALFRER